MADNNVLLEKITEFATSVKSAQEIAERAENSIKKFDGLDADQIKKMGETATQALEAINAMHAESKANEQVISNLEKHVEMLQSVKSADDEGKNPFPEYGNDFARWMRKGEDIPVEHENAMAESVLRKSLFGYNDDMINNEVKLMSVNSNPDGGYLLRPQWSNTRIGRIFETSPIRQIANIQTTNTDSLQFIIDDNTGFTGGWVSEQQARGNTPTPQIGVLKISVHEQYANPMVTQKLLDDAGYDIESWLGQKTSDIFARTENTAFVNGSGQGQPRGFLTYPNWTSPGVYTRGAIEQIPSGSGTGITGDAMKLLKNSVKEPYQGNATFVMKRDSFGYVITLKDGNGRYLLDTNSLKVGDDQVLLNRPVVFADDMPVIAAGNLPVAYGDWQEGYTIVDRFGIRVIRDNLTQKPFTQFYTNKRVGGDVTNYEAIKLLRISLT